MGTVHEIGGFAALAVAPDKILNGHIGELESVLLVGRDKNGKFVAAMSSPHLQDAMWLATKFMHKCHDGSYAEGLVARG